MVRVALYHRVSTLDQNPELARGELRAAAQQRGGVVVLDVEETGSGAKNNRPGLQRILAAGRAGELDVVMVWKLDRFGRSTLDLLANIQELEAGGVAFVATSQGLEIGGPRSGGAMGRLILTVMAGMAEFERELIRERTSLGMANAKKKGKAIGRPRALLSEATVERAAALRAGTVANIVGRDLSWREVRALLILEGFANIPDAATLARHVQKGHPETRRGKAGFQPRGPRLETMRKTGRF